MSDDGNYVSVNSTFVSQVPEAKGTVTLTFNNPGVTQLGCWIYGNIVGNEGNGSSNTVFANGPTIVSGGTAPAVSKASFGQGSSNPGIKKDSPKSKSIEADVVQP